jgi:hypothetical protein
MTRVAAAIVLASLLAGCASDPVWTHPTKDRDELKADAADCERFFGGVEKDRENCMKLRGWKRGK